MTAALQLAAGGGEEEVLQEVQEGPGAEAGLRICCWKREVLVAVVQPHRLPPIFSQIARSAIGPACGRFAYHKSCCECCCKEELWSLSQPHRLLPIFSQTAQSAIRPACERFAYHKSCCGYCCKEGLWSVLQPHMMRPSLGQTPDLCGYTLLPQQAVKVPSRPGKTGCSGKAAHAGAFLLLSCPTSHQIYIPTLCIRRHVILASKAALNSPGRRSGAPHTGACHRQQYRTTHQTRMLGLQVTGWTGCDCDNNAAKVPLNMRCPGNNWRSALADARELVIVAQADVADP